MERVRRRAQYLADLLLPGFLVVSLALLHVFSRLLHTIEQYLFS
jgi:hypothetical protein